MCLRGIDAMLVPVDERRKKKERDRLRLRCKRQTNRQENNREIGNVSVGVVGVFRAWRGRKILFPTRQEGR